MQCLQKHREGANKEQPALASAVLARAWGKGKGTAALPGDALAGGPAVHGGAHDVDEAAHAAGALREGGREVAELADDVALHGVDDCALDVLLVWRGAPSLGSCSAGGSCPDALAAQGAPTG